jgi:hypothetical protein
MRRFVNAILIAGPLTSIGSISDCRPFIEYNFQLGLLLKIVGGPAFPNCGIPTGLSGLRVRHAGRSRPRLSDTGTHLVDRRTEVYLSREHVRLEYRGVKLAPYFFADSTLHTPLRRWKDDLNLDA